MSKKEEIENLIGISLELETYRFSRWELSQWQTYIKSKINKTPITLSLIVEECLGIEVSEAKFISTVKKYYVFNKEKNFWNFMGQTEYMELLNSCK